MRYLNKVVFINSATIQYAEVQLDGNVHFIGTQGVGKSTLLRAVLFFYNADSQKLGISKEKKSFAEYYFPYQNAYLVYEINREFGPYCILTFKSQGKACFRFINAPYNKDFFISPEGVAYESWEKTKQILDAQKIVYSRKIDRYEEYRDILYGNTTSVAGKNEFEQYAILQSKQYQNIPRTIQNVFLNSKLEAEFIKQTIIMSLNEDNIEINLQNHSHHLKNFQEQLKDIDIFKQPFVQKQAENVLHFQMQYQYHEKEKNSIAQRLSWAYGFLQRNVPRLINKREKANVDKAELLEKVEAAETRFRNKMNKIQGEISIYDNEIKKAKQKLEFYAKQNIDEALTRVNKKQELESQLNQLKKQSQLLTSQFTEASHKYEALLQNLDNSLAVYTSEKKEALLQSREQNAGLKDDARAWFDQIVKDIRLQHKDAIAEAMDVVEAKRLVQQDILVKRNTAKLERYFETEIADLNNIINDLLVSIPQTENKLESFKNQRETLQKRWELDEAGEKQKTERTQERLQAEMAQNQAKLENIADNLRNSESSFYGWLNKNQKGWEKNIGKLLGEDILFNTSLSPQKVIGDAATLFGIQLQLEELPITVKTLAQYQKEAKAIEVAIYEAKKQLVGLRKDEEDRLDKLRRKYNPLVKQAKEGTTEHEYLLERRNNELQQAKLQLRDVMLKADEEKKRVVQEIESQLLDAGEELRMAKEVLTEKELATEKLIKAKAKDLDKKTHAIDEQFAQLQHQIGADVQTFTTDINTKRAAILEQQNSDLESNGADTQRITEVQKTIVLIQNELNYIERMRDLVTEYNKDKRELIDKSDENKERKSLLDKQYTQEQEKFDRQKDAFNEQIKEAQNIIQQIQTQLKQSEEDQKAFSDFEHTDAWQGIIEMYKEEKEIYKTEKRVKLLIDELNSCYYSCKDYMEKLKEAVTKFIGNFSKDNVFKFPDSLQHNQAYHEFAQMLNEFINNSKLETFEKQINERFAGIINLLGKETNVLLSKAGEIQTVITNINKDFESKNFVGAIRKIELRLHDSANSVVQTLKQIKEFNDEHAYDLGALNLFSTVDQTAKNKKAVSLLDQLSKAIIEYKRDIITLSDSFELKFRIEENQNDTGWVEKLSNVGSEGTDVLVKAMINIMLLNVFKESASGRFKDFQLHCMMDEIGKLHPNNVKGILDFANDRKILLINGSPTETNALDYRHIYKLEKDGKRNTRVKRIISNYQ